MFKMSLKLAISILALVCILNYASAQRDKPTKPTQQEFNNFMVPDMEKNFHRKPDIKNLPPFGIQPFKTMVKLEESNNQSIQVEASTPQGDMYKLNLRPLKDNVFSTSFPMTVVFRVRSTSKEGQNYIYNIVDVGNTRIKINGTYYEDYEKSAVVLVSTVDGNYYYDGTIGEGKKRNIVRPIPEKWKKIYGTTKQHHIIYKRSVITDDTKQLGRTKKVAPKTNTKNTVSAPTTLYPKLLIVVDYNMFDLLGKDYAETIQYVTTFWNGVNLKYRVFKDPEIKILVTGILIAEDPYATYYVHKARSETVKYGINPGYLISLSRHYFQKTFINDTGFSNFDGVVIMTPLSAGKTVGLAFPNICHGLNRTSFVHDVGRFISIPIAAHELGHLLGLRHDSKEDCEGLPKQTSTIMNPSYHAVEKYIWSNCSTKKISKLTSSRNVDCLKVRTRYSPGSLLYHPRLDTIT